MNWWTSVVDGTKSLGDGATWVWNNAIKQTVGYAANTAFYVAEQVLALREAIPAVVTPPVMKIVKGGGNILVHDVLPVVGAHYANNSIQNYLRPEDPTGMLASYMVAPTLTLINYAVWGFTYRQASKVVVHTLALDALGSSAFNEHKAKLNPLPPTLCGEKEEDCNFKRKFKGSLREPIVLAVNDFVLLGISKFVPYGEQVAWILGIFFYGEYITRMATPERCERHKAMKSESILSLGLAYTATSALMDYALESTVGMPPYLYLRTLRHLLLLAHINVASHMTLPLVRSAKDTIPIDPLVIYDRTKRFAVDVVFAGLMQRIPIDFKPPPGAKPFIPLSTVFKFLTKVLESDLEQVKPAPPGFFKKTTNYLLPSMFHSPKNAVNDPVIKEFWPDIRSDLLYIIEIVEATKPVKSLTTAPTAIASTVKYTLPVVLNYRFGLPIKLSEFLLSLSKKEDFWDFVTALRLWIERNNVSYAVNLAKGTRSTGLHESNRIIELPEEPKTQVVPSANELKTPKTPTVTEARQLIPSKTMTGVTANSLFSTKQRSRTMSNQPTPRVDLSSSSQDELSSAVVYN
ncbi:hypothetical protein OQJ19_06465 [Fluoribacter gormanii]|uniref:Uncharacterized protein n=1 Tax=Fluoribacter gormanii TaxID=464 RepID=A0A377GFP9_9GAMM|nr:hypothetical protein [Fluoribacter gormanii]KTD00588.1 hypothetical protein Lgor_3064 [Fluoribacter gormanii]MCW8445088.1 hypothetical protein [Fluoribacter gormanii]MCW8470298.1 hypothetical protein [Fluoribacter gormanii]SIR83334.1 hypothetical protein SAMN05421777_12811 [Fluoribacter gormanii]STO23345.1 Uncharacterised protein [Fluoribacter gormanii]